MSRNALLTDRAEETDATRALIDPRRLAIEVHNEVRALEEDRDPFVDRAGTYYRSFVLGSMSVPAWVHVPKAAIDAGKPLPLVIALHGRDGDPGQFPFAYGAGLLRKLADEKQFILVAPSTYHLMTAPDAVPSIADELSLQYLIDPSRVYVIGHSMGALAAQAWATRYRDHLAGAVLLAGASEFVNEKRMAPTLLVAAELDPWMPRADLKHHADEAMRRGLPVELKIIPNTGHTLVVNEALPAAVDWLLQKRKP
jgi:poly(3-hydroxybutyrate) depolymerase